MLLILAVSASAFAKGGDPVWPEPFAVTDLRAGEQYAKAMTVDRDGNVIIVGSTNNGSNNYHVAKFYANGSGTAWTASPGGTGNDAATAVAVDSARNIIVTGYVWNTTTANYDIRTIKYDQDGTELWRHDYDAAGGDDQATAVAVDSSGNIYVAGYAFNGTHNEDFLLIKYLPGGPTDNIPAWKEISDISNQYNRFVSIHAGSDGIAVTGYSMAAGADVNIVTRKYAFGEPLVQVREWIFSSPGATDDRGVAVKMDGLGNVIMTGHVTNAANNKDIYIAKYDPNSDTPVWTKTYLGEGEDEPKGLWLDSAGEVYVTGSTATLAGGTDFYTGNGAADIPVGIVVDDSEGTADAGGVFVTGYTTASSNEDYLTLKLRKDNGSLLWQKTFNGSGNKNDRPVGIALIPSTALTPRNAVVAGWTRSTGDVNLNDFTAIKYDFGVLNAPTRLTATVDANNASTINLSWSDNSINEEKFVVERKLGEGGIWASLPDVVVAPATSTATVTHADTGLAIDKYYYYRVRAFDAETDIPQGNGYSHYSNEAHALTKVVSYTPPVSYRYDGGGVIDGDYATAIITGADNNPVVTGYSSLLEEGSSTSRTDDYLSIKLDRAEPPNVIWKARFDSGDFGTDQAAGLALDSSGNLLVTGTDGSNDLYTIKVRTSTVTNPDVEPPFMWDFSFGTVEGNDLATAIEIIRDGSDNSVVIGYGRNTSHNDDLFLIKLNSDGSRPWEPKVWDSGRHDQPTAVAVDAAGNIIVTGFSYDMDDTSQNPTGSYDWFTRKYNGVTGNLIWEELFDGGHGDDQPFSLAVDAGDNVYVTGYTMLANGTTAFQTIKYRSAAKLQGEEQWIWKQTFSYPGLDAEAAVVRVDPIDGFVVVAGTAFVNASDSDFHLIRYNPADGSLTNGGWEINFDLPATYDYVTAMAIDPSGNICLAGNTRNGPMTVSAYDGSSNIMGLIYNHEGAFLGATNYDGAGKKDEATAIAVNSVGDAFIAGSSVNAANNADYLVLKQTNSHILVPAPFTATPQTDYSKVTLTWQHNNPSATFLIERTLGPAHPYSKWDPIPVGSGSSSFEDTGLTAETSYCYRIHAIANLSSRTTRSVCVTTKVPPPALDSPVLNSTPSNPSVPLNITLTWSQVASNTGYLVERKIGFGQWSVLASTLANENSHVDTQSLTPGTTYRYRVSTKSAADTSVPGTEQSTITRPAAPNLAVPTYITNCQMQLSWPPQITGADGYTLYYKWGSNGYIPVPNCENLPYYTTTCTATGLTPLLPYTFQVKAKNASGESTGSNEQTATPVLTKPTLKAPASITNNSMDLTWDPAITGATSYTLEYRDLTANNDWGASGCPIENILGCTVSLPTPNHLYAFRVKSNNVCGSSEWSTEQSAWAALAAPVQYAPNTITDTSVHLTWGTVFAATTYSVQYRLSGGNYAPVSYCTNIAATECTVTNLAPNRTYEFQVRAGNAVPSGDSVWSSPARSAKTLLSTPTLNSATGGSAQVALAWTGVAEATGYTIQQGICTSSGSDPTQCRGDDFYYVPWSNVAEPITGLSPGTNYRYRVIATVSGNVSAPSNVLHAWTNLTPPTLTVLPAGETALNLLWDQQSGETNYRIERGRSSNITDGTWTAIVPAHPKNSVTHEDKNPPLDMQTQYCYRVVAYSTEAVPPPPAYNNPPVCKTTPLPTPILNLPTVTTAKEIRLSWNHLNSNTGYELERCESTYHDDTTVRTVKTPCTYQMLGTNVESVTDSGLSDGYTYRYRVRAWYNNSTESTAWSVDPGQWATTIPEKPVMNTPSNPTTNSLYFSWADIPGDNGYKIYWKQRSGGDCSAGTWSGPILNPRSNNSYTHSPINSGTYYCYRVVATGASGPPITPDSASSDPVSQMTMPAQPAQPTLTVNGTSSITVYWGPTNVTGNTGYRIDRSLDGSTWTEAGSVGTDQMTLTTSGLNAGTLYYYRVAANSNIGYSSPSAASSKYTSPVQPSITATPISEDRVDICWPLVYSASNYKVFRDSVQIANPTVSYSTSYCGSPYPTVACPNQVPNSYCYQNTGLTKDTSYSYYLVANNGTDSQASDTKSVRTMSIANQNLTATALDGGLSIRLDWTPIPCSPQVCDNPDYFEIQRQVRDGNWVTVKFVDGSITTYTDNLAIDPNKKCLYRVRSLKGDVKSPFSEVFVHAKPYGAGANICR
jgi:uncharacterized delta-60 repeat protein